MSDAKSPHIQNRDTPQWGLFQRDLFWKLNEGEVPQFNTRESFPHTQVLTYLKSH